MDTYFSTLSTKKSVEKATNTGFVIILYIKCWQLNLQKGHAHKNSVVHISNLKKIKNLSKFQILTTGLSIAPCGLFL